MYNLVNNMWKKYISLCVSVFFTCLNVCAQSSWMEWEEQIGEKANLSSWEELYENLSELAEHPFNINTVTKEELEQLPFLSDKMVENILYYVYKYGPLVSLNELWGVEGMDKQTQTFLKDFVYVGNSVEKRAFSWKNLWKYNKQEVWMRTDIPLNEKAGAWCSRSLCLFRRDCWSWDWWIDLIKLFLVVYFLD